MEYPRGLGSACCGRGAAGLGGLPHGSGAGRGSTRRREDAAGRERSRPLARAWPLRWGHAERAARGGMPPRGACAPRARRCVTRALEQHREAASRSHRLPPAGRRAPATELFRVGRAGACAGQRAPCCQLLARALPALGARALSASRAPSLSPPAAPLRDGGFPLPSPLPSVRSPRLGVSPRPAASAAAARAPPAVPHSGKGMRGAAREPRRRGSGCRARSGLLQPALPIPSPGPGAAAATPALLGNRRRRRGGGRGPSPAARRSPPAPHLGGDAGA